MGTHLQSLKSNLQISNLAMFSSRSEYDRSVNSFSPEGRLFQVEYAIEAIKLGSTAVGIQTAEGVVLVVEKRITSKLIEPSSIEKVFEIDKARVEAQSHWFTFNELMSVERIAQSVSNLALAFGEEGNKAMSRPFGVSLLFAGIEPKTGCPKLFHLDPSGTYIRCDAKAIGSASEGAQGSLQDMYHKSMTLKEATKVSLTILKQVMEEKLTDTNIEICQVTTESKKFHIFNKEETLEAVKTINQQSLEQTAGMDS